jgi:long-chain acyl-CoA synthetase
MSDPLSLLPFAVAAGGGSVDGVETQQWVAAGHTLLSRSASLVRTLASGRSGILLPPCGAFLTALAASDGRGAVLINPLASKPEIVRQLQDANVTAVFTNSALSARLPDEFPRVLMDEVPRSALVQTPAREQQVDLGSHFGMSISGSTDTPGRDEEAVIVYTSAMAGTPLGAILTHANLISNARFSAEALGDEPKDHCLAALPFAHLFGLVVCTSAPLLQGGRVTTMDRFHPGRALEFIEEHGVTRFMGVPSMYSAMLNALERRGRVFQSHKLRMCLGGGAPLSEALQERWYDATGVELRQGYGLTEGSPASLLTRADATNERGTMGTVVGATEVRILARSSNTPLPDEQEGEICVRGPHVFRGYVSNGMDGLLVKDGWLRTGDLGVRHANGTFSFRGLIKAMFTRNGFNIYPREIEAALLRMPGVNAVRAWGVPDNQKENDIAVRVSGTVSEADVKLWSQQELAAYKVPSHIEIGEVSN